MRISARNQMTGKVHAIHKGEVTSMVEVSIAPGILISAIICNDSFEELGIDIGKEITTIVKASDVILGVSEWHRNDRPVDGEPLF